MNDNNQLDSVKKALENSKNTDTIGIFTHKYPDPDAISSMMALKWLIQKLTDIKTIDLIYEGKISHPQNQVLDNLLEPNLRNVGELEDAVYNKSFLVDTIPNNAGIGSFSINFDLVIDHHKEPETALECHYCNLHAGSCTGTIFEIIKHYSLEFDESLEMDQKIATGILVGIATDTETLCSPDTTKIDVNAWSQLLEYRDPDILARIINYEKPKLWVEKKAEIFSHVKPSEGIAIKGIGILDNKHRDLIADIADDIRSWEEVHTAIIFALIDGKIIEGSVRTNNSAISAPNLSKMLGTRKDGTGGGKPGKGAYRYEIGGGGIDTDDSPEVIKLTWELFNKKESERILTIIRS